MSMYQQLKEVWAELIVPGGPFEIAEIEVRGNSLKTYATAPLNLRDVLAGVSRVRGARLPG
jgi:long-chain acyl-CoA synthetase